MRKPPLLPRGLRAQVTLSVALLVMLVVGSAGVVIALRIDHRDRVDIDRQLMSRTVKVRADASKLISDGLPGDEPGSGEHTAGDDDYGGLLAGSQSLVRLLMGGVVVAERGETPPAPLPLPTADGFSTISVGGQSWRSLVQPVDPQGRQQLQVLQSLEPVEQRTADNGRIVAATAAASTLVAAAGVWIIAGLVLQPLQRLRRAARRIRPDDLERRLPVVGGPREVRDLSSTLNGMLERLQASMLATRRFTADAGHELRTPLTSLGMDIEVLCRNPELPQPIRDEVLTAITVEHRRIVTLLKGLQTLARGDAGVMPASTTIDAAALADEVVRQAQRRHPDVAYRVSTEPGALVEGWEAGLQLAVGNLLDNAATHGRQGGSVDVSVRRVGSTVWITVSDDGPGIPADQHDAMRRRFTRGERPRGPGSGLGLALVDQQAALHGGRLELGQSLRGGLQASLVLPPESTKPGDS